MTLWVYLFTPVKLAFTVDSEDSEGVQDIGGNTSDNYTRVEIPCNTLMTESFEGSDVSNLIQRMFSIY